MLMAYEVTRDMPTQPIEIETPLEKMQAPVIDGKKTVFVVDPARRRRLARRHARSRAGGARRPHRPVPRPEDAGRGGVLLQDARTTWTSATRSCSTRCSPPATRRSAAVDRLKETRSRRSIRFVCLLAAPEGLANFHGRHPDVPVYHRGDRRAAQRPRLHRAGPGRRGRPPLRHEMSHPRSACRPPHVEGATSADRRSRIRGVSSDAPNVLGWPRVDAADPQRHAARRAHRRRRAGARAASPRWHRSSRRRRAPSGSTRTAGCCRRRSSTRTSTWTRRSATALPRVNLSGTLLEGIALWGELKPLLTQEALVERALRYCDWAVAKGLLAIRSHVDVCDDRLLAVRALLEVRERVGHTSTCSWWRFPQDGLLRSPDALANLKRALDLGCRRGRRHSALRAHDGGGRRACAGSCASWRPSAGCGSTCTATRPTTRCRATSRRWPSHAQRLGLHGRVTGSHLTSMHSMDNVLRLQADRADRRGRRARGGQPADQHHAAGPPRQLPEAARHDARAGAAWLPASTSPSATTA